MSIPGKPPELFKPILSCYFPHLVYSLIFLNKYLLSLFSVSGHELVSEVQTERPFMAGTLFLFLATSTLSWIISRLESSSLLEIRRLRLAALASLALLPSRGLSGTR